MRRATAILGLIGVVILVLAVVARVRRAPSQDAKDAATTTQSSEIDAKDAIPPNNQATDLTAKAGHDLLAKTLPDVKKWKMTDLVPDEKKGLDGLENRSFERGKKLFTDTKCIVCHSYGDQGGFSGPNLTEVGARFGPVDILSSIIEPSKVIADAYRQKVVVLEDGRVLTGRVVLIDDEVQITPDDLQPDRKITVSLEKVESMEDSAISPMPEGLINHLTRQEILDLVAFVICRENAENEMFTAPAKKK